MNFSFFFHPPQIQRTQHFLHFLINDTLAGWVTVHSCDRHASFLQEEAVAGLLAPLATFGAATSGQL